MRVGEMPNELPRGTVRDAMRLALAQGMAFPRLAYSLGLETADPLLMLTPWSQVQCFENASSRSGTSCPRFDPAGAPRPSTRSSELTRAGRRPESYPASGPER